jgi:hypothetical protein
VRAALAGLAAGVALAGLAALLIWAANGSSPAPRAVSEAARPAAAEPPPAAVPVPTETRSGVGGDGAPPPRSAGAIAAAAAPTPAAGARSTSGRTISLVPSIETTPVEVAPPAHLAPGLASASGSPGVRAPAPASAGKSYHGKVELPDGGSLELGGIVWSEADPRALVNDRVVGVGAYVQGYTIERIEEDRVMLEKDGKRITITVK